MNIYGDFKATEIWLALSEKEVDLLGTAKLFHCRDTTFAEDSSRV